MRVGIFTESYPPLVNGVSTSILMLEHALTKLGHEVFIITVSDNKKDYVLENNGHILRLPSVNLANCYDYKMTSVYPIKAVNMIKKMNLDVIHSNVEFTVGIFARVVSEQLSIPLVHTYHTNWEDYTHYITKNKKILDDICKKLLKYLVVFFEDKTVTELIVPSNKIYNLFKDKYKFTKNIHIIQTGIETSKFYKENFNQKDINSLKKKLGIKKKDFVVMTVSRLAKEKSVDRIINNHKELVKKYSNMKLLIVGDGPDIDKLKDEAKSLGVSDSVIFTGKVPLSDIPIYYQLGNVFVTASKSETQGLTVVEAISSSLPVVAVKDDSFVNSVIEDFNGFVFTDDEKYINSISKLYEDKDLYNRLSNQSRLLSADFSSEYFALKVLKVYETAIENYKKDNKKIINKIKNNIASRKYKKISEKN
ncbi:glycosyltransferase group 1 family [Clostridium sp. CAG:433]|nr:glycosyltransferase group 1 family [Clostridium sp. CAG:433]